MTAIGDPAKPSIESPVPAPGLHAPGGIVPDLAPPPPGRGRAARLAWQLLGFLIGLGLLGWAVSIAISEKNRQSLEAVSHAPAGVLTGLLGTSLLSVMLNGVMFWVVLRPLRRIGLMDTVLTNGIAVFLSVLPFKINLVARVLIHHRRDGVAFRDILAWFAAMSAMALSVLLPLGLAGWWRGRLDAWWWIVGVGGSFALGGVGVLLGRAAMARPWLSRLSLGADRVARHAPTVFAHAGLRLADIGLLCARFWLAAMAADVGLGAQQAVMLATSYFLLSVLAPAGALGFREMGVAGVGLAGGADASQVALVTLVVTGAEFIASGALSVPAFFRLRPDRLIGGRAG